MADDLMSMFTSMGTSDPQDLVSQFMQIVPGAPVEAATFFLEANSMNLQAAIMCYMDQGGTGAVSQAMVAPPQAQFVCDVTIGEGEEVSPGTRFQKTWRLQNTGQEAWPRHTMLAFIQGEQLGGQAHVKVPQLEPGGTADISVNLQSPTQVSTYAGSWRLCVVENGVPSYFGEEIWVVITVSESGMLDALQRMHGTSIDEQGLQVNPLMGMGNVGQFGNAHQHQQHAANVDMNTDNGQGLQQGNNGNLFAVPQFGSLSSHTFGAHMPTFGQGQAQEQQTPQEGDSMDS